MNINLTTHPGNFVTDGDHFRKSITNQNTHLWNPVQLIQLQHKLIHLRLGTIAEKVVEKI